jgi:hypothetical protein
MQRLRYTSVFVLVVASSALTFWIGLREGARAGLMVDAVTRGAIALNLISMADHGVLTQNMVATFESDVDVGLLQAHQLERYPLAPLLEPLVGLSVLQSQAYVSRLAAYRKFHRSSLEAHARSAPSAVAGGAEAEALAEVANDVARSERIVAAMVAKHAPTASSAR